MLERRHWSALARIHGLATLALLLLLLAGRCEAQRPPPLSIDGLTRLLQQGQPLNRLGDVEGGRSFTAYLVSYRQAGLLLHALVAVPRQTPPAAGFPVLIANHGFHPDPPRYGVTAEGRDWRPGDYYRSIPDAYAAAGFLVVMPDYRGHNRSEGLEYTQSPLASAYYAEDVVALLAALPGLPAADARNVFMWGHSMGGPVTLQALLAASNDRGRVRGASLWSSATGTFWEQAFRRARARDPMSEFGLDSPAPELRVFREEITGFGAAFAVEALEPEGQLSKLTAPLMLQHAVADPTTSYSGTVHSAAELHRLGKPYVFFSSPGSDHFFKGSVFDAAVARDVAFFRQLMRPGGTS